MYTKISFKKKCYELYQLDWMMSHGYSLQSIFKILKKICCDESEFTEELNSIEKYLDEQGFNGEIFACEQEFYDNEYQDKDFMKNLLSAKMFEEYKKIEKES